MSGKLDQSLDQIMKDGGETTGRRGGRNQQRTSRRSAAQKAKAAIAAPVGGVKKNTKVPTGPRPPTMVAGNRAARPTGDSKIIISNLPDDVSETQIKDYVTQIVGATKRVMLTYGPNGRSRGIATIIFANPTFGAKAAKALDGVQVDNRKMHVELVLDAKAAPVVAAPKSLADRMSKPKSAAVQPKQAVKGKATPAAAATTNGAAKSKEGRNKKSGRGAGRPGKKTADELDTEMDDYFGTEGAPTNGAVQPVAATNGGDAMVDEVL